VSFDNASSTRKPCSPRTSCRLSRGEFHGQGAILEGPALEHKGPLALVELQNGDAEPQYVAGTENFYVITRYNWSSYYAMAVIELGREVKGGM
jgi:membrane-bound lytic murein transglycosylase B